MAGGQFMGRYEARHSVPGFSLAHLIPTVAEEDVPEHTHAEAHYVLLMEGTYVSIANGAPDICRGSALIYNPPGTVHRDRFRSHTGQFFTITVSAPMLCRYANAFAFPNEPLLLGTRALALAQNIAQRCRHQEHKIPLVVESLCTELLGWTTVEFRSAYGDTPAWLLRARELLHDDSGADLTLADIARITGVHPVHLIRAFRRRFHCTPGDYLRRCRLDKAAARLLESRETLAEIAIACGFFDQAHFSRAFKRAYGVPPRRYRETALHNRMPSGV